MMMMTSHFDDDKPKALNPKHRTVTAARALPNPESKQQPINQVPQETEEARP